MKKFEREQIKRIVVRGANWVGDAVMTVPALRELRRIFPGAQITLATRAWAVGIFDGADFLDDLLIMNEQTHGLRSFRRQVKAWRARPFDLSLLFTNSFESALIARMSHISWRAGYSTDGRGWLLTHPFETPAWRGKRHEVFYYLNLVAELERALDGDSSVEAYEPEFALQVSNERQQAALDILINHGVRIKRPLVALCPGSTNSRAKRWPAERYSALADKLIAEAGASVFLIGAREELDVTQQVVRQMREPPHVLTGETSLAQTVSILSLCDLLITNDTGPAHIADALSRPTLVIFGPTNPHTTRPFSPRAEIVRHAPDCAPCMLRDCPIDHRCMTSITPDEVFTRAMQLIERGAQQTDELRIEVAR